MCRYLRVAFGNKATLIFSGLDRTPPPRPAPNSGSTGLPQNVFGTKNLIDASISAGVKRFVMISTDKAVNPNSTYGTSKLLAEELVIKARRNGHRFIVVRFGNVLGSRGSILPLFRTQILKGGPVTITHPETSRFFMTIPEASQLILQAGAMGQGVAVRDLAVDYPDRALV